MYKNGVIIILGLAAYSYLIIVYLKDLNLEWTAITILAFLCIYRVTWYFSFRFVTLLHQCLNSIKKGSAKEISLASHAIGSTLTLIFPQVLFFFWISEVLNTISFVGLLALTTGPGDKAQEILEESITPILQALKSGSEASKISSVWLNLWYGYFNSW